MFTNASGNHLDCLHFDIEKKRRGEKNLLNLFLNNRKVIEELYSLNIALRKDATLIFYYFV